MRLRRLRPKAGTAGSRNASDVVSQANARRDVSSPFMTLDSACSIDCLLSNSGFCQAGGDQVSEAKGQIAESLLARSVLILYIAIRIEAMNLRCSFRKHRQHLLALFAGHAKDGFRRSHKIG